MELAVILLLVASQLNVQVESQVKDVACDDNDVFRAVDVALTKYNNQKSSGPQFVLYRIITASLTDSNERTFTITYEIRESNCMIETGKNWKECSYKDSAKWEQGECTAILKSQNGKEFKVIEQNCHIIPAHDVVVAVHRPCLGCFNLISTNHSDLEAILKHALQSFNEKSKHEYLFDLKEVMNASRQVVNGWNYKVQYSIMQTDCSKKEDGQLSAKCKPVPQGEISVCSDFTHVDPQMKISIVSQVCNPRSDSGSSVTQKMSIYSPELNEPLRYSLEKINSESKNNFYFKMDTIQKAESLVGPEPKYIIEFLIKETECSKEKDKYSEDCTFKELGDGLKCVANIPMEDEGTFNPTVHCEQPTEMLMKRPPGFSPFRAAALIPETNGAEAPSEPQTSDTTDQEEAQGPGKEKGLIRSFGHGHRKEHSSGHGHKDHPGLGLGHKHGHAHSQKHGHRHKPKHGEGHQKHEKKDKKSHGSWTNGYLDSPIKENSPSSKTQEETQGPPPLLSSSLQEVTITPSDFQDLDLLDLNPTSPPSEPTTKEKEKEKAGEEEDTDDDWIPDIPVQPKSPLFTLVPDFPEPSAPKCPGRPWKPIDAMGPVKEESPYVDFDLSDALEFGKK
ncbi:kininogen-1 [Vombatus ursinus]|uniref:Cystatin kininogen-type domain-containing protein n=1 Tax=Vombatus ursinus TaxID=29139 RepID=A0A4X2LLB5_VOMUR|nr:kininogen-1 [Vombatus ursinus]